MMKKILLNLLLLFLFAGINAFANPVKGVYNEEIVALVPPQPPTVSGKTNVCLGNSTTLVASTVPADPNVVFRWYNTSSPLELIPIFTGANFNTGALLVSRSYFVESYHTVSTEKSARVEVIITVTPGPNADVPIGIPDDVFICSGGSVTISAFSLNGSTIFKWYDALTGGNLLYTGNPYTTGPLTISTIFYLESENAGGCSSLRTQLTPIVVYPNPAIPIVTPVAPIICSGDSVTFTATSIATSPVFKWYDAPVGGNLLYTGNPFKTGAINNGGAINLTQNYYVEVTDVNGCTSLRTNASVIIRPVPDFPTITPPVSIICSGDSVSLTASSLFGGATYNWYDQASGGTLLYTGNPFNTGPVVNNGATNLTVNFYAELTDVNGCKSPRNSAVVLIRPALTAPIVNPVTTTICSGDSATFTGSSLFDPASTYRWYDAATGGTLLFTGNPFNTGQVLNNGGANLTRNYYVEVEDANGCISIRVPATLIVRPALDVPLVNPAASTICSGDSVTITASTLTGTGITYKWYDALTGGTLIFSGNPFKTGAIVNSGASDITRNYYVEAIDANGCRSLRAVASVLIRPAVTIPTVDPITATICSGDSVTFTASSVLGGAATFKWYDASTGGNLLFTGNPFNTGKLENATGSNLTFIFYVEVIDGNGCRSLRTPATVVIRPLLDVPTVDPPVATICSGDSATFTASSTLGTGVTYKWYDAITGGTLLFTGNPFNTGSINNNGASDLSITYYVELTDANGCKSLRAPATVIITPALDAPLVTPLATTICSGDSASFTASSVLGTGATYNWYDALTGGTLLFTGNPFNTGPIVNGSGADVVKNYYVEVVDSMGCKSLRTAATVTILPALDLPIVTPATATICSGDSVTFTASSALGTGVIYRWYDAFVGGTLLFTGNPFNTGAINNTGASDLNRIYYVELEDSVGCRSLRTPATVIVLPALDIPLVTPSTAIICSGDSVTFTASSVLGSAANYRWYDAFIGGTLLFTGNPFNTGELTNSSPAAITRIFYVELEDTAGCKSLRTPATVIIRPALDVPIVDPATATICSGDSVTFTASSLLGGALTYNWYDAPTGGNLLFTGNPYNTGPVYNNGNLTVNKTYYVELVDSNGCKSLRALATVLILPNPDVVTAIPQDAMICKGKSTIITATSLLGDTTFNWYNGLTAGTLLFSGNPFYTGRLDTTTTFYVSSVDSNGCSSLRFPVIVVVVPTLDTVTIVSSDMQICQDDSVQLSASSSSGYANFDWFNAPSGGLLLFNGDSFNTGPLDSTTTFYVESIADDSCRSNRYSFTIVVTPGLLLTAPEVKCEPSEAGSYSISWTAVPNSEGYEVSTDEGASWEIPSSGATGKTHTAFSEGPLTFQVRALGNPDSCYRRYSAIGSTYCDGNENNLKIFYNSFSPNGDGSNDVWYITDGLEDYPDNIVDIFNRWGESVYNAKGYNNKSVVFTGKDLDDGAYYYILKIPSLQFVKTGYVMIIR